MRLLTTAALVGSIWLRHHVSSFMTSLHRTSWVAHGVCSRSSLCLQQHSRSYHDDRRHHCPEKQRFDNHKCFDLIKQLLASTAIATVVALAPLPTSTLLFPPLSETPVLCSTISPQTSPKSDAATSKDFRSLFKIQTAMAAETSSSAIMPVASVIATPSLRREANIMDLSQIIDPSSANTLLEQIQDFRQRGTELQIVTVNQVQQVKAPKELSTRLFNQWKLDAGFEHGGIMVLVVKDQRRVEIEVDRTLNGVFPADWCTATLQRRAVPKFRQEEYGEGLVDTIREVSDKLRDGVDGGVQLKPSSGNEGIESMGRRFFQFIVSGFCAFSLVELLFPLRKNCPQCGADFTTWDCTSEDWEVLVKATDKRPGKARKKCICRKCGNIELLDRRIPQYDGRTVDSSGGVTYYYDSSSSSDGGSDGGGGGSGW